MEIKMYYEIGIVLFWLLFAYLFMDKFLFKGGLGEICFGKMRRRMAKGLHGVAGWFDPAKEEKAKKKGKKRKTEKSEVSFVQPEPDATQKTAGKQSEKQVEKDSLVFTKSYGTRQQPPTPATGSQPIAGGEKAHTFTDGNEKTPSKKAAQVPPERIPDLFRDKRVEEWRASSEGGNKDARTEPETDSKSVTATAPDEEVDTDDLNEELEELNCAREEYSTDVPGIGPDEIDLIIDLCNGREIPTNRKLALLKAIHHIKDTQIERSILESINGSDNRISKFLDEAERMSDEAGPGSD